MCTANQIIKNACLNPDDYPAQVKSLIDQNTKMYQKEVFLGNFFTYSNSLTNDLITLHHMLNKKILKQHFQGNYILPSPIYIGIDPVMSQKSFNIKVRARSTNYLSCGTRQRACQTRQALSNSQLR